MGKSSVYLLQQKNIWGIIFLELLPSIQDANPSDGNGIHAPIVWVWPPKKRMPVANEGLGWDHFLFVGWIFFFAGHEFSFDRSPRGETRATGVDWGDWGGRLRCYVMMFFGWSSCVVTWTCTVPAAKIPSLKLTVRTWKQGLPKRKLVFKPSNFRCELLVSGRVKPETWWLEDEHFLLNLKWSLKSGHILVHFRDGIFRQNFSLQSGPPKNQL